MVLSTACFGSRLESIEDQAFAAVAMGFRRVELGLSEVPPRLNGFEDTRRETGVQISSIVAGCLKPSGERLVSTLLSSPRDTEREQAMLSLRRHIQLAQRLGAPVVIVRGSSLSDAKVRKESEALELELHRKGPSEELSERIAELVKRVGKKSQRQIEHLCRSLHTLLGQFPETRIALEPAVEFDDLISFEAMGWVLEDLKSKNLGYWHDVAHIHARSQAGLPGQGPWLDAYASRMLGVHLQDAAGESVGLPPGQGQVDFRLVCEYVPKDSARVIDLDPSHGRSEILGSVQYLSGLGF